MSSCLSCDKNTPKCPYKHMAWNEITGFYPSSLKAAKKYCDKHGNCKYHKDVQLSLDEIIFGLKFDKHTMQPKNDREWAAILLCKEQAIEKLKKLKEIETDGLY